VLDSYGRRVLVVSRRRQYATRVHERNAKLSVVRAYVVDADVRCGHAARWHGMRMQDVHCTHECLPVTARRRPATMIPSSSCSARPPADATARLSHPSLRASDDEQKPRGWALGKSYRARGRVGLRLPLRSGDQITPTDPPFLPRG